MVEVDLHTISIAVGHTFIQKQVVFLVHVRTIEESLIDSCRVYCHTFPQTTVFQASKWENTGSIQKDV